MNPVRPEYRHIFSDNLALSRARSEAVARYLVEHGIDPARVQAVGFGESRPVASNETEEERREIILVPQ